MITKHVDTYYTNSYLNRFADKKSAIEDEKTRNSCKYKVKTIRDIDFYTIKGQGIEAIDDYAKPCSGTGTTGNKIKVYLFKNMIENMQKYVETYGENVGTYAQHRGMGHFTDAIVVLEENKE